MPFWPVMVAATVGLLVWGILVKAWVPQVLILIGYAAMRANIVYLPDQLHEAAGNTLWVLIAAALCYAGAWVPGFLYCASGLTYTVFKVLFSQELAYMSASAIVAEIFAILALLAIFGGLRGRSSAPTCNRRCLGRLVGKLENYALGVAARQETTR